MSWLYLLLVVAGIGGTLYALLRRRMPTAVAPQAAPSSSRKGVYVKSMSSAGSIKVRANKNGVTVESDAGGKLVAVVDGREIDVVLKPGERRHFESES